MSDAAPLSRGETFDIPGGLDAPALARRVVLNGYAWPTPRTRDAAALMLAEVVANAVLHGGAGPDATVRVDVTVGDGVMTFSVHDPGPGFMPPSFDWPAPSGGLGLVIVDRLARRWGVVASSTGTRVWFELATA